MAVDPVARRIEAAGRIRTAGYGARSGESGVGTRVPQGLPVGYYITVEEILGVIRVPAYGTNQ
jgi:hypothetical protein